MHEIIVFFRSINHICLNDYSFIIDSQPLLLNDVVNSNNIVVPVWIKRWEQSGYAINQSQFCTPLKRSKKSQTIVEVTQTVGCIYTEDSLVAHSDERAFVKLSDAQLLSIKNIYNKAIQNKGKKYISEKIREKYVQLWRKECFR